MRTVRVVSYDVKKPDLTGIPEWFVPLVPESLTSCYVIARHDDEDPFYYLTDLDGDFCDEVFSTLEEAIGYVSTIGSGWYVDSSCGEVESVALLGASDFGRVRLIRSLTDSFVSECAYQYVINPEDAQRALSFVENHPAL